MNTRCRFAGLALAALTLPFQAGCHNHATAPASDPPSDPLVQTVRIEPAEPHQGETVTILSSIENRGSEPQLITHLICTLGLGGDLTLEMPPGLAICGAVSSTGNLAPGARVEMLDLRVVMSEPGLYTLEVTHLADPRRTATLKVRVIE